MDVRLVRAGPDDAGTLQNLFQLYTHDFSEFWAGTPRGELRADGRFPDYPLEPYWTRPGWEAWLICVGKALAGFALVNDAPNSGRPAERSVAEFFVVRKHRGQGVGLAAARQLLTASRALWEVAVVRRNVGALRFWRTVVRVCARGPVEELDLNEPHWNGVVFRFRT